MELVFTYRCRACKATKVMTKEIASTILAHVGREFDKALGQWPRTHTCDTDRYGAPFNSGRFGVLELIGMHYDKDAITGVDRCWRCSKVYDHYLVGSCGECTAKIDAEVEAQRAVQAKVLEEAAQAVKATLYQSDKPRCPKCCAELTWVQATDFVGWSCMGTAGCVYRIPSTDE